MNQFLEENLGRLGFLVLLGLLTLNMLSLVFPGRFKARELDAGDPIVRMLLILIISQAISVPAILYIASSRTAACSIHANDSQAALIQSKIIAPAAVSTGDVK